MTADLNGFMKRRRHLIKARTIFLTAVLMFSVLVTGLVTGASSASATLQPLMIVRGGSSDALYVLGNMGCVTASCLRLVRTTDALSSYTAVTLPPVTAVRDTPSGSLGQVVFATALDGYALDEVKGETTLYVTRDGARSWRRQTITSGTVIGGITTTSKSVYVIAIRCEIPQ